MATDRSNPWRVGNVRTICFCVLFVVIIGFALLLAGAILSGIAYTEVRPNVADENYDRYIKANLNRVIGPVMLALGLLIIFGGCIFLGVAFFSSSKNHTGRKKYSARASVENLPDMMQEKKMLSQV